MRDVAEPPDTEIRIKVIRHHRGMAHLGPRDDAGEDAREGGHAQQGCQRLLHLVLREFTPVNPDRGRLMPDGRGLASSRADPWLSAANRSGASSPVPL